MDIFFGVVVALFGVIVGSFLNVVILRFNTGWGIGGRSHCFSCMKQLSWYELLPLVSFLGQKGRCRGCKSRISLQYPLVEAFTALLFVTLFFFIAPTDAASALYFAFHVVMASLLVVIFVYDLRHKIIPNSLAYSLMIVSFLSLFIGGKEGMSLIHMTSPGDFLVGVLLFVAFGLLWLVSKGKWIGFGDAKLVISLGWLAGYAQALSGIMLAFWIGAVVSIAYLFIVKNGRTIKGVEVPFAPYLILGIYIAFFFHLDFLFLG